MGRFKSRKARRSGLLSLPSKSTTIKVVGSLEAGGGACYHLPSLGLTLDCGANPNGGAIAEAHLHKVIESSISFPSKYQLVSHFHLDHHGGLAPMFKGLVDAGTLPLPRLICTDTTWKLLGKQLRTEGLFIPDGPSRNPFSVFHVKTTKNVTLIRNEHSVPGSVGAHIRLPNGKTIFYTGDFRKFPRLPKACLRPDLCILDCTGALKTEPTEGKEKLIRKNIMTLAMETLESSSANVIVSTFSTNLERVCGLEAACRRLTKRWPTLLGFSLLANTGAYRGALYGERIERFVLCTGVWGQPKSQLVRMSQENMDYPLNSGDRVILSGSMPTWNPELMAQIVAMCDRLTALGVEVIVDSSLDLAYMPRLRRAEIHCSGHASFSEIVAFIKCLRPKSIFATHGDAKSRRIVEEYCRSKGITVVSMNSSSEIILA